jgi:rhodanese-related sulfurtransferase
MKRILALLVLVACFTACQNTEKQTLLTAAAFAQQMQEEPGVLLDVRTIDEYQEGHLKGAQQLDYYETASFSAALDGMDRDKTYYIYCRSGGRSSNTLLLMQEKGFKKVYDLDGGILAWRKAQLPVETP